MDGMIASWDGSSLNLGESKEGHISYLQIETATTQDEVAMFPDVEANSIEAPVQGLLWPLENLLVRHVLLPLPHPRFLDAKILGQELAEQSGEEPSAWWFAWHAEAVRGGISGLVFGLPEKSRLALSTHPLWKNCPHITVDAWVRLTSFLPADRRLNCAVLDADSRGLFLGFFVDGCWKGMRRLNLVDDRDSEDMAEDVMQSLKAMGYTPEEHAVYGRLDEVWAALFRPYMPQWQVQVEGSLPGRHEANLDAASKGQDSLGPNFRCGTWAVRKKWQEGFRPWRRTAMLAACLMLLLMGRDLYALYNLQQRESIFRQGIEDAFHRGLPEETAIVDPLRQLQAAAGPVSGSEAWVFLRQLQAVAELKKKVPGLNLDELLYAENEMRLRGKAQDFSMVNRIRDILSGILGHEVKVEDTELEDKQVRFRMKWL